jgi:hypothetical protein
MYVKLTPYEEHEIEVRRKKEEHLRKVNDTLTPTIYTNTINKPYIPSPCAHDSCPSCHGTGVTINGGGCIHSLVCNCHKCGVTC